MKTPCPKCFLWVHKKSWMTCFNSIIIKIQIYAFQSKPKKGKIAEIVLFTKFSSLNCIASKRSKVKGFIDQFYCCYKTLFHYIFFESAFDSFLSSALLPFILHWDALCAIILQISTKRIENSCRMKWLLMNSWWGDLVYLPLEQ